MSECSRWNAPIKTAVIKCTKHEYESMMACIPIHKSEILAALCIRRPSIHEHRSPVIVSLAFAEKSYRRRARGVDLRDDEQDLEQRHERHE